MQTDSARQYYWTFPPLVDGNGTPNVVALPASATLSVVDLTTVPGIPLTAADRSQVALEPNPIGHFVTMDAQGGDIYYVFGPSLASFTATMVAGSKLTATGSGYVGGVAISFSGGGGSGAAATASVNNLGQVYQVSVTSPGGGYTSAPPIV